MITSICDDQRCEERILAVTRTEKFSKLLHELEICNEDEQKQKIKEMNKMIYEMEKEEFRLFLEEELYNKIDKMIEEKKLTLENAILLLKHIGYCKALKRFSHFSFNNSLLSERFEKMIIDENEKKEEKNEMLLFDLCECFVFLSNLRISSELLSICVPCLLKVASKKEESEEVQKKVEMALLALSRISNFIHLKQELYFNEITEIMSYHQVHHNLTRFAYYSMWMFLIRRIYKDKSLEAVISNELHLTKEAIKELEELMRYVYLKKEKEEGGEKEPEEENILLRWVQLLEYFLGSCLLRNEKYSELIRCVAQTFRAAKDNFREISFWCIVLFVEAAKSKGVQVDDLLESGAVDTVLEEIRQLTLNDKMACEFLDFFDIISRRLKGQTNNEADEAYRKAIKRKALEKMEEEGCEDIITSFNETFGFFNVKFDRLLSLNTSDYFVNI
ncbi:uncharacterized protein MONOS_4790 [Monocercomonoides exilis]|uniref:uncharacterized protein n=1 Tax=Monocercomonoides exilis TaxID=2049356 RepID=UPI00355A4812|nr:hypothetical protein MONOS_4790 [Monocercomonoides exilis]|eukprot:MONOS_4790.1-p1 / transcript=MONOS_4790.1 / gene=MONOS_4790 / organism=Monocercomonoides_exilis_PA203 / gene_product=unspecified product / transcript_product=unspecified product / location=Mono_scaffold00132:54920-56446(-) / protein_length=446 / sequence_SO=supercontig / SO=protein_coding / is_pseudo=false